MNTRNIHPPHLQPTNWKHRDCAVPTVLRFQIPTDRQYATDDWLGRKSLQEPSRYARAFGLGFCMLVAVGVVAGLVWLMEG